MNDADMLPLFPEIADPRVQSHASDGWLFEDGWLTKRVELEGAARPERSTASSFETLLAWNALLAGGAKFAVSLARRVCGGAELPWGEESASPDAVAATDAGFDQARRLWRDVGVCTRADPLPPTAAPQELLQAAIESGWGVHARADGSLVADLECASGHWQARLLPLPTGTLALVELVAIDTGSAEAREAAALLLLLAGAAVRWARPALRTIDDRPVAVLEIVLPTVPTPAAIADALSALSVACRLVGAEARALLDEAAACDFRQVMGPISDPDINTQRKEENHGRKQHA